MGRNVAQEPPVTVFEDPRGPNVRELRQAQRRLSSAELEALIADYEAVVVSVSWRRSTGCIARRSPPMWLVRARPGPS